MQAHYFSPPECARGKVMGRDVVVVVIIVDTNTGDLGTSVSCKHKYVEFGKKLASVCSESSGTAYKHHK